MKKLVFFVVIMLGLTAAYSQPAVRYHYDNSGNRNSRLTTTAGTLAQWIATGNTRCAVNANNDNTGAIERQERDNNSNSSTYNQTRWVVSGYSGTSCTLPPYWVNTGNIRCQLANGLNTGYTEYEQQDMNTGSPTYGQTQWLPGDIDEGLCPPPITCENSTCEAYGPAYRCVFGVCEEGYKVYTNSYYDNNAGYYICFYHYEWSDGIYSDETYEWNYEYCNY